MKKTVYFFLNMMILLSLAVSSGQSVKALEEEEGSEAAPVETELAEETVFPSETEPPEELTENMKEEEEIPSESEMEEGSEALIESEEASDEEAESEEESEDIAEEEEPLPDYVIADEIVPGHPYALVYEENGSYTLLYAENGELRTETGLSVLNEETIAGRYWIPDGEYGVYSVQWADENNAWWLYLDGDGWHLDSKIRSGWEASPGILQFTDDDDNIYGLFDGENAFVFYEAEDMRLLMFSGSALGAAERDPGQEGMHYIAFASDRHNNTDAIGLAMGRMPESVEYVDLVGDLVGGARDMKPSYQYSTIYNEVHEVFPSLPESRVSILWASHDENVIDDAEEGVTGVYCREEGSSGLIYTSLDEDGNPMFYLYGIAFLDMQNGSAEPAEKFKDWADSIPEGVPVIVICHMPVNANRGDNRSSYYWNDALNYAATEGGDTIVRNVIFLHGHNHTTEQNREYFFPAGSVIQVPSPGKRDRLGSSEKISYTYITCGYLNANKTSTLIGVSDTEIRMKKYWGEEPGDNVVKFDETITRVQPDVPRLAISETALYLEEGGESVKLSTIAKNLGSASKISWTSENPDVASVKNGKVKPLAEGKTVIKASVTVSKVTYTASCTVFVSKRKVSPSGNAFVLTDTLEDGQEYLIVNANEAGNGKALKNDNGTITAAEVTIQSDAENGIYIWKKDTDDSLVWTSSEADMEGFHLNGSGYLSIGSEGLVVQESVPRSGFGYAENLLSHSGGFMPRASVQSGSEALAEEGPSERPNPPRPTVNYVVYDSETEQFSVSQTASSVYLYARKNIEEKKQDKEEGSSEERSESSASSADRDFVITCQMAGYPEGYAWDEGSKACRMGYIDQSGSFHSTASIRRVTSPNTSDGGLSGSLFSFLLSVSTAGICLLILKKY